MLIQIKNIISWLNRKIANYKPFFVALAYSPWLILLYLYISTYSKSLGKHDLDTIQNFIEWFGTAYSLLLALVLVNVWNQFDTLNREFDREVDAIATLYQTTKYAQTFIENGENELTEGRGVEVAEIRASFQLIINKIEKYIRHVVKKYQDEHILIQQRRNGEKILESIGREISSIAYKQIIIEALIAELYKSLNEALDVRGDRISRAKQSIPQTIWLVAFISSFVWLLPFFALNIGDHVVSGILTGGAAFVIVVVFFIINDLGNPFYGTWNIDIASWRDLLEIFDPNSRIIFIYRYEDRIEDIVNNLLSSFRFTERFAKPKCELCTLSREGLFGFQWRNLIRGLHRYNPEQEKNTSCEEYYLDDYIRQEYEMDLEIADLPIVLLRNGDDLNVLVETQDIRDCTTLNEFEGLVINKIKVNIHDFDQWHL